MARPRFACRRYHEVENRLATRKHLMKQFLGGQVKGKCQTKDF